MMCVLNDGIMDIVMVCHGRDHRSTWWLCSMAVMDVIIVPHGVCVHVCGLCDTWGVFNDTVLDVIIMRNV